MLTAKRTLTVETAVKATEATKVEKATRAYTAPELHVVGKAVELVQGNFGYTDRDQRYYWR